MKRSTTNEVRAAPAPVAGECVCVTLRRAARALSQVYDEALASSGLRITQFSLLRGIARLEPVSIGDLAQMQVLDRTTMSRNLAPLERAGLVRQAPGDDRRTSQVQVTPAGHAAIARALPLWRKAQRRIRQEFGDASLGQLRALNAKAEALAEQMR
ncbi:MAG: MarR family winged helix-turn-helix transcriptional regulator [Rudaea sp.]